MKSLLTKIELKFEFARENLSSKVKKLHLEFIAHIFGSLLNSPTLSFWTINPLSNSRLGHMKILIKSNFSGRKKTFVIYEY
jgi:hypothetical protein